MSSRLVDSPISVFDGVASLVDKSLLRQENGPLGEPRFAMLETIREYGVEQLDATDQAAATRDAHASWFIEVAERLRPLEIGGIQEERPLDILELEHDNFRAALSWLDTSGKVEQLLQLSGALGWFWYLRGHLSEGRSWLDRAIDADSAGASDKVIRARAVRADGKLAWLQGDLPRAAALLTEAKALSEALGDLRGLAHSYLNLGVAAEKQGNESEAVRLYEEALTVFREVGDNPGTTNTLIDLADAEFRRGDLTRSQALTDESIALSRRLGDKIFLALSLFNSAQLCLARGEPAAAFPQFRQSLIYAAEVGNSWLIADALGGLAAVTASAGDPERGARWLGTARSVCDSLGTPGVPHHEQFNRSLNAIKKVLPASGFSVAFDEGRSLSPHQAVADVMRWEYKPASQQPAAAASNVNMPNASKFGLTRREMEVLGLMVDGKSSRDIAEALFISPRTATTHVANILSKLGVNSRSAAVALAFQRGIV